MGLAEPYIFISYSHADRKRVLAIVEAMEKRGYRVWYDANIEAGRQWTAELADNIAGCEVFLPFISRAFTNRKYCRKEVVYAEKKDRIIVPVLLEKADLSGELQFLMATSQEIRPAPDETPEAFAAKLDAEPLFQRCRRTGNAATADVVTRERPSAPTGAFVGREEKMQEIQDAFRDGETAVILYGMGGIGKSELCRKLFCDAGPRMARRLGWATWRGTLRETFYQQFLDIQEQNIETHWGQVKTYLDKQGHDLLLFLDNADDLTEADAAELTELGCRFLITSRRRSGRVRSIAAGTLTPEQCRVLYRRALYEDDACTDDAPDTVLDELLRLAAYHTLAVHLLAKTQSAAGLSTAELLAQLRESGFDLSGVEEEITYLNNRGQKSVEEEAIFIEHMRRVFDLSTLREPQNVDALRALQGMSLLAPNTPVRKQTVKKWLDLPNLNGLNRAADAGWLNKTLENGVPAVSIHPVIAAVVQREARPDAASIDALAGRLHDDMIPEDTEVFTNRLPVLEHAVALDKASGGLRTANYGKMLVQMGYLLDEQADYDNALSYLKRSVKILKKTLGKEHTETATAYNNIGYAYREQGEYSSALEWYQKALRIREKVLGTDHPDTALSYNNIGGVYQNQGEYSSALEWYQKALRIQEKVLGTDHPYTALSYNNIGYAYDSQGKYSSALEWYQKALRIREKVLGTDHPYTALSYNNIGCVYQNQGEYSSALEWYQKALRIQEKVLGTDHPSTATTYHNIGTLYFEQGDYVEARAWLEKALAVRLKVRGPEHPSTKNTQEWLDEIKRRL